MIGWVYRHKLNARSSFKHRAHRVRSRLTNGEARSARFPMHPKWLPIVKKKRYKNMISSTCNKREHSAWYFTSIYSGTNTNQYIDNNRNWDKIVDNVSLESYMTTMHMRYISSLRHVDIPRSLRGYRESLPRSFSRSRSRSRSSRRPPRS